jgi:uncharacterized protein (DUF302 family)
MIQSILRGTLFSVIAILAINGCDSNTDDSTEIKVNSVQTIISTLEKESKKAIEASLVGLQDNDKIPFGDGSFSPFERVAVLDVVRDSAGNVDYNATNIKANEIAMQIALTVANINEPKINPTIFKASDWIVIDKKKSGDVNLTSEDLKSHLIHIPTSQPFNPNFKYSKTNTNKVHLVELCNPEYAGQAVGTNMIGGRNGAKVPNGAYHTTALPCEVTVYSDNKAIYVDMLNPETIFTLFFTEVFSNDVMKNEAFKKAMLALPTQVKKEITTIIHNALDNKGLAYTKTAIKMGSIYSAMSKAMALPKMAEPYKHLNYKGTKAFTSADAKHVAEEIMNVMTIHGEKNAGVQNEPLLSELPSMATQNVQPLWRSARHEPFKVPGGIWVVEACSPVYAKEALNTGEFHTPALPCEISVNVNPDDNRSMNISILNPDFMFNALFADGMADMNQSTMSAFKIIIDNINGDLEKIVDYAVDTTLSNLDKDSKKILKPISY